jgi:hypothetical protein
MCVNNKERTSGRLKSHDPSTLFTNNYVKPDS